jgi:hypothetical protein
VRARLAYAHGYAHWDAAKWACVFFTDEKKVYQDQSRMFVQRPSGERHALDPAYSVVSRAHPESLNVWGCFSAVGAGCLYFFEENMDAKKFVQILTAHVLNQALSMWPQGQWYYLQDNDPKHKSHLAQQWFFNNGVTCLDHPACSPDLNPIENLLAIVQHRVDERLPVDMNERKRFWIEEWTRNDDDMQQLRRRLASDMIKRLQLVIRAQGFKIDR